MTKRTNIILLSGLIVVIVFVIFGTFYKMNDVTTKWNEVVLYQESSNDLTHYIISFVDGSLTIEDEVIGGMDTEMSEAEFYEKAEEIQTKKEELTLKTGEYSDYRIKKNKELYEITVPGEKGFTYSLERTAPRKFIGEDGIEYMTSAYID